jgi:hypothetical protein
MSRRNCRDEVITHFAELAAAAFFAWRGSRRQAVAARGMRST